MRVNERVHVHNERNFPRAKLDSEINVPFLEHGGLYFLSHNKSVHIILFNLKLKKGIGESVQKNRYSKIQIITAKTTIIRTLYVHVNGVIFRQISSIFSFARHALPVRLFPSLPRRRS